MGNLGYFILREELESALLKVVEEKNLAVYTSSRSVYSLLDAGAILGNRTISQIYVVPVEAKFKTIVNESHFQPRFEGWIQIDFGSLYLESNPNVLSMTTISWEDRKNLLFKPSLTIRSLKSYLCSVVTCGVKCINVKFGGEEVYNDTCYSNSAYSLQKNGLLWKYEIGDNLIFLPLQN